MTILTLLEYSEHSPLLGGPIIDTKQACQLFLDSKKLSGRSKATIALYSLVLRRFSEGHVTLPSEPEPIESWIASIDGQPETRHMYFRTLRTFYRWLELRHKVLNPMRVVEAPSVPHKLPRYLSQKELGSLLGYPDHSPRDKALLYFLIDTGARAGEATNLRCEDVHEGWAMVTGKTGQRFVPLSPIVQELLSQLGTDGQYWLGRSGPLTPNGITQAVCRAMRNAGLRGRKLGPHLLRHTFATMWTGEELVLQDLMGHSTLGMTKRYRQLRKGHILTQHAEHSPLKNKGIIDTIDHRSLEV